MSNFIALVCPSCGGHIQTDKDLEKLFCVHCGTQLIIGQGADGLLVPLKARALKASTALKDAHTAQMLIDYFKERIADLESEASQLRRTFLQYCVDHLWGDGATGFGGDSKTNKLVNQYAQMVSGKPQLTRKLLMDAGWAEKKGAHGFYGWHMDRVFALNIPALNTPQDLFNLYQFVQQRQKTDKVAFELARAIQPASRIFLEIQANREKLGKVMDIMTGG